MYINGYNREKVMQVIRKQNKGRLSYSSRLEKCAYRAEDGNKCLVGCFIPDSLYDRKMEGQSSTDIIIDFDLFDKMPMHRLDMNQLQSFHDIVLDNKTGEEFFTEIEEYLINMEKRRAKYDQTRND